MPSLHDLGEFKASFLTLGGEIQTMMDLELPLDDLSLPEHEPAISETPVSAASPAAEAPETPAEPYEAGSGGSGTDFFGDLGDLLGGMNNSLTGVSPEIPADWGTDEDGAEFGDFLDTIPDDFAPEDDSAPDALAADGGQEPLSAADFDIGELPAFDTDGELEPVDDADAGDLLPVDDVSLPEFPAESDSLPEDDQGLPPGLLDGFADEIEAERNPDALAADDGQEPLSAADFDIGELPAFDTDGELEPVEDSSLDLEDLPGFGSDDTFDFPEAEAAPDALPADGGQEPLSAADFDIGELPAFDADGELESVDDSSLDLEDLPGFGSDDAFGFPEAEATTDTLPADGELDALDFSVEEPAAETGENDAGNSASLENFPDFNAGESFELAAEDAPIDTGDSLALTGSDGEASSEELSADEDGFDFGGEAQGYEPDTALEEISLDSFDSFDPDAGNLDEAFGIGDGDDLGTLDEFSLPGFESARGEPSLGEAPGRPGRTQKAAEVEEINLSSEDLERLLKTLSSYPLNLRVACEELIAEQAVLPDQMSKLVKLLVNGAPAKETASLAGKILDRTIPIPKGFEKKTGAELEAEQASFAYIFTHKFLPVLRLFMMISLVILSAGYLCWKFIYTPLRAEKIYELGIERIDAGEYGRANERFAEAFQIHPKKDWFYTYARAFRDARQYTLAGEKYQELLYYTASKNKRYIPEKTAVLEYADLETNYIGDYETADNLIRRNILDYFPLDREGLLALGDNSLAWGEYESGRLEDAREAYARLMERYGRSDPLLERMLKYFIRTDNLGEVLPLQTYFMASPKREISAAALSELGGYFLDKRLEEVRGVPNEYLDSIGGIREILLRAIQQDPMLPESYYHLARYYNYFENLDDERLTLEVGIRVFGAAKEESAKRIGYHIGSLRRYAEILTGQREFFSAEENLVKAANLYEDGVSRRLLSSSPEFGKVYAALGDLEYFVKDGDMQAALDYYRLGEENGWAPPEVRYRMGAAHYQLREWGPSLNRLFEAHRETPFNRRVLYALGNVSYMRGNYFAAQGYYDRLLEILDEDRSRFPPIMPTEDETQLDLAERLMVAQNNLGVTLEAITERTGNNGYRSQAQGLYADSERAWDVLTRNPVTMIRMHPSPDINAPGINPAYLNVQNSLHPVPGYESQFFLRIDKDMLEPSAWEELAPPGYRLSEGIHTGR